MCLQGGGPSVGQAQVGGRKCLLSECLRWWRQARPGVVCQVACLLWGLCPNPTAFPLPCVFLVHAPARALDLATEGAAASVLKPWRLCHHLVQWWSWGRGWQTVSPQPPLQAPLLTPSRLHCALGWPLGWGDIVHSGGCSLWVESPSQGWA